MKTFLCFLLTALLVSASVQVGDKQPVQNLKLPDYYVGRWTDASIRAGDFSYFFRCDGTGEERNNRGKKEKSMDIYYRVLSITDDEVLLFVKQVDTQEWLSMVCIDYKGKKKKECMKSIRNPFYQYWLLSPSESSGSKSKMMRIEKYSWDYESPVLAEITKPFDQSDQKLIISYNALDLRFYSILYYYFKSSLPCAHK